MPEFMAMLFIPRTPRSAEIKTREIRRKNFKKKEGIDLSLIF